MVGNRGRSIHRDTVISHLRERGIHYRRPVRCQVLTQRHRLERQRWGLNNRRRHNETSVQTKLKTLNLIFIFVMFLLCLL